jgi:sec-independent protein translocase protein TatC
VPEKSRERRHLFARLRNQPVNPQAEMTFIDHLEELRWHIIRSVLAVLAGAILIFANASYVVDQIFMGPAHKDFITYQWLCALGNKLGLADVLCLTDFQISFQSTAMTEQFLATFTIAFAGGFILAFPYVFWELWRFIKPALHPKELKGTNGAIAWISILFFLGVAFGYFILTPFMVNFYANYKLSPLIEIRPTLSDYIENLMYLTVGIGLLFQLPFVLMLLTKVGILSTQTLRDIRKYAFVVILILAAIITPSTDPFSLALVSLPLYLLYEMSITLSVRTERKRKAASVKEWE